MVTQNYKIQSETSGALPQKLWGPKHQNISRISDIFRRLQTAKTGPEFWHTKNQLFTTQVWIHSTGSHHDGHCFWM